MNQSSSSFEDALPAILEQVLNNKNNATSTPANWSQGRAAFGGLVAALASAVYRIACTF